MGKARLTQQDVKASVEEISKKMRLRLTIRDNGADMCVELDKVDDAWRDTLMLRYGMNRHHTWLGRPFYSKRELTDHIDHLLSVFDACIATAEHLLHGHIVDTVREEMAMKLLYRGYSDAASEKVELDWRGIRVYHKTEDARRGNS